MAIAEMTHLRLIGLRSQENKILDGLENESLFEPRATGETSFGLERGEAALFRELKLKQSRVAFAVEFLRQRKTELVALKRAVAKGKQQPAAASAVDGYELSQKKLGEETLPVTRDDYSDARAREYELFGVCDALQNISFEISDCRARAVELKEQIKEYAPFAAVPLKLSAFKRTGGVTLGLFYGTGSTVPTDILDAERCAYECCVSEGALILVTAVRTDAFNDVSRALGAVGFSRCPFTDDCTAKQKISALQSEIADTERSIAELSKKALNYEKYYDALRILYDVLEAEIERAEADAKFLKTDSTFIMEGWIPEKDARSTVAAIRKNTPGVMVQMIEPTEADEPPTYVVNNKAVQPYEQITNMYSAPKYREIDPNPIMSVFFFLFFGLMIGDAVYGVILTVLGLTLGMSGKFGKGAKQLLLLVGMGGISAIVWGILFGGYLSIDFGVNVALWFNPIEDPMTLLVICIVFGCVQLCLGYVIKFVKLCMAKKPWSAVFDAGSIIILFAALACLGITMLVDGAPEGLKIAAIALAVTGLALIIIFGGRNNKNVVGKIFGGFKGLYGLVNLLSDILSYCRLFGLGLATVAIGLAFNTLGSIIFEIPGIGYPLGVIILIPLHVFNIAIGVLGAYVHNARLQFLEFYGKFYDGGGRLFEPIGYRGKNTRLVNSDAEKQNQDKRHRQKREKKRA